MKSVFKVPLAAGVVRPLTLGGANVINTTTNRSYVQHIPKLTSNTVRSLSTTAAANVGGPRISLFHLACGVGLCAIGAAYSVHIRQEEKPTSTHLTKLLELPVMTQRLNAYNLREKFITPDGNCQFRAIADQLMQDQSRYGEVRDTIISWLKKNEKFPIDDSNSVVLGDFLDRSQYPSWDAYCRYMSGNKVWGDHLSLVAASEAYGANVWILSDIDVGQTKKSEAGDEPYITIISPRRKKPSSNVLLAHYHELHYTSLYPENPLPPQTLPKHKDAPSPPHTPNAEPA